MAQHTISDSGRIFQNPVLEALTKTHIAIPLTLFYGSGVAAMLYGILGLKLDLAGSIGIFLVGAFFFTLVEYLVHRYFYHMEADNPKRARIQYIFHGIHHDHPRDKKRLALPPVVSVVLATLFMGLFRLVLGPSGIAFGGGFMTGYATYLMVHYAVHTMNPPKNLFGVLWRHHNLHHYVGDEGAFGVSSPLWDHVFGTMPVDPKAKRQAAQA